MTTVSTPQTHSLSIGWDWLHKTTIRTGGFSMLSENAGDVEKDSGNDSPPTSFRERVFHVVHSGKFQVAVIILIVLDALLVIAELLFDLKVFEHPEADNAHTKTSVYRTAPHALHYTSLAILGLFLIEISFRIYAMRLQFFHHKLEVLDAIVVVVSFVLDIVFRENEGVENGIGLLIVLRLWRVTRIVNGMVLSIKMQAEKKIEHEKKLRESCEIELKKLQDHSCQQEIELQKLCNILTTHGIELPVSEIINNLALEESTRTISADVDHQSEMNDRKETVTSD